MLRMLSRSLIIVAITGVIAIGCARKAAAPIPSSIGGTCVPAEPLPDDERKALLSWLEQQKAALDAEFRATPALKGTTWQITANIRGMGDKCDEVANVEVFLGGKFTQEQYKLANTIFDRQMRSSPPTGEITSYFGGHSD